MPREPTQPEFTVLRNVAFNDGTISNTLVGGVWGAIAATTEGIESTQSQIRGVSFVVASETIEVFAGWASYTSQRAAAGASFDYVAHIGLRCFNAVEGGNLKGRFGQVQVGDRVSVALNNDNLVEYRVNGAWKYTSEHAPQFPLYLKVNGKSHGPFVREVRWILRETEAACCPNLAPKEWAICKSALQAMGMMGVEKVELEEEFGKAKAYLAKERADNEALRKKLAFRSKTQSDASHTKAEPEVEPTKQDGSR